MRDSPGLLTRTREYRERKRECRYAPISSSHQCESPSCAHELVYSSFRVGFNLPHGRPPCAFGRWVQACVPPRWRGSPHADRATRLEHCSFDSVSLCSRCRPCQQYLGHPETAVPARSAQPPSQTGATSSSARGASRYWRLEPALFPSATYAAQRPRSFALEERPSLVCGRRIASPALSFGTIRQLLRIEGDTTSFRYRLLAPPMRQEREVLQSCLKCQAPLRLIALIKTEDVAKKILTAMHLPTEFPELHPARRRLGCLRAMRTG